MRLSDPRKTTEAEAARLALEGKTVVMITCSIHATESRQLTRRSSSLIVC